MARAASLGVARSALFPTVAAIALASTIRQRVLIREGFQRQTLVVFEPTLHVEYLVLDFGGRGGAIDLAKANLLVSDLAFNDTHRKIIFQVESDYYQPAERRRAARCCRSQPEERTGRGRRCPKQAT